MDGASSCPYCGEEIEIFLDEGGGSSQDYVEDCAICCRPMRVILTPGEDGEPSLRLHRLDE